MADIYIFFTFSHDNIEISRKDNVILAFGLSI